MGISTFSFWVLQEWRREEKRAPWQVVCVESVCRDCSHAGNTNWHLELWQPFVVGALDCGWPRRSHKQHLPRNNAAATPSRSQVPTCQPLEKNPTKVSTGPSDDSGNRVQPCFFRWLWTTNPVTSLGSKQSGNCKKSRETSETPCSFTPAAELWVLAAVADTPLCCCALVWSSGEKTTQTAATQVTCLTHVATLISWMCEIPLPSFIRRLEEGPVRVTWQLPWIFWLHYFQPLEELWFEVEGQASVTLGWQSPGVDVNARTLSQKWIRTILTSSLKASHYSNQGARRILQLSIWEIWSETSNSENLEIPTSAFKWNEPQIADFSDKTEVGNNSTNNPGEWSNLINPLYIYKA